ncbi:MAG: hypothetical protein WAV28_19960, partial [Sedimentisphaerales bacterium]
FVIPAPHRVRDKLQRESSFSLWTPAPRFRGDKFTPAEAGAGVTSSIFPQQIQIGEWLISYQESV